MTVASFPFAWTHQAMIDGDFRRVTVQGLLRLGGVALVLEFRETVTDASGLQVVSRGEVRCLEIALEQVASLELHRRLFRSWLLALEVHSLTALEAFPYASGSRLALPVARAERERAREVCGLVTHRLADARLRELEAGGEIAE